MGTMRGPQRRVFGVQAIRAYAVLFLLWVLSPIGFALAGPLPIRVFTDRLNVRQCPSLSCKRLTTVQQGQAFVAFEKKDHWYHIYLPDRRRGASGWIEAANKEEVFVVPVPTAHQIEVENLTALNVRSGPGTSFPPLALAWTGQRFVSIEHQPGRGCTQNWHRFALPSFPGGDGWSCSGIGGKSFLKTDLSPSAPVLVQQTASLPVQREPSLHLDTSQLVFTAIEGQGNPQAQFVTVTYTADMPLYFAADVPWLSLARVSEISQGEEVFDLQVSVETSGLPAGAYQTTLPLTLIGTSHQARLEVVLTVLPAIGGVSNPPVEGLMGEYVGQSAINADERIHFTRLDPTIDFDWGKASPRPDMDADYFSVLWEGKIQIDHDEPYTFHTITDDGIGLWIDKHLVIDHWGPGGASHNKTVQLETGLHDVRLVFFELEEDAFVSLYWSSPSTPYAVVPSDHLFPLSSDGTP